MEVNGPIEVDRVVIDGVGQIQVDGPLEVDRAIDGAVIAAQTDANVPTLEALTQRAPEMLVWRG